MNGVIALNTINLLADISRQFFKDKKIYKYKMKKVAEMTDDDVIVYCHWFCESYNLTQEFDEFRTKVEFQYYYCSYLQEYIEPDLCYDMQMIAAGYIKDSAFSEMQTDKTELVKCCSECCNSL